MLTFCRRHLTLVTILAALTAYVGAAATISTLSLLPTSSGGVFTQDNLDTINANTIRSNTTFTNLNAAATAPVPATAGGSSVGSATLPFQFLWFSGASSTPASNNYKITGTATAARTITFPDDSISLIGTQAFSCGATTTCANTVATKIQIFTGTGQLVTGSPSTFALTAMSPAFTSTSTFVCNAIDITTAANNISVLSAGYVSGSAVTFTGPNTNTDSFRYTCVGN